MILNLAIIAVALSVSHPEPWALVEAADYPSPALNGPLSPSDGDSAGVRGFTPIQARGSGVQSLTPSLHAEAPGRAQSDSNNPLSIEFTALPAGDCEMGADLSRDYITSERAIFIQDEFPVRRVKIKHGFEMSKYEITNLEYEQYDPAHAAWRGRAPGIAIRDNDAVVYIDWHDAVGYCRWLSKQDAQHDYRLPTEAEWEYACRAGTRTPYYDGIPGDIYSMHPFGPLAARWCVITNWLVTRGNRPTAKIAHESPGPVDLDVRQAGSNAWGLVGMLGGVEEWTQDWYGPYAKTDCVDPVGYKDGTSKVVRGGSHNVHLQTLRSANRSSAIPTDKHFLLGFRVVRIPKGQSLPAPKLKQAAPPWAKNVSPRPYSWPADQPRPFYQGPISLYNVNTNYHSAELAAQFNIPLYTHNHSPAITWANNGDLLLVWFSGESEKGQELTILGLRARRRADGSLLWDRPVAEFFKCADRNMHGSQLWNNAARLARGFKEPFTLYHINGISTDGKWTKLAMAFRQSPDYGATWTQPVIMKQNVDADHLSGHRNQPQGNVVVTPDGDFLSFTDGAAVGGSGASLNFSNDGGKTWDVRGRRGPPGIHVGGAPLPDERILAFSRDEGNTFGSLPQSLSSDKGQIWSFSASEFPPIGMVQRLVLLRLDYSHPALDPGGRGRKPLLLVSFANDGMAGSDATGRPATIHGAYAALSWDDGKTWPIKQVLSDVTSGTENYVMGPWSKTFALDVTHGQPRSYWSATQTPDGIVHLTDGRLYYAFNVAWLNRPKAETHLK